MIITTTDPITGEDLANLDTKPYVVEGEGHLAVKIYFESEETRRRYLNMDDMCAGRDRLSRTGNPDMADYN